MIYTYKTYPESWNSDRIRIHPVLKYVLQPDILDCTVKTKPKYRFVERLRAIQFYSQDFFLKSIRYWSKKLFQKDLPCPG